GLKRVTGQVALGRNPRGLGGGGGGLVVHRGILAREARGRGRRVRIGGPLAPFLFNRRRGRRLLIFGQLIGGRRFGLAAAQDLQKHLLKRKAFRRQFGQFQALLLDQVGHAFAGAADRTRAAAHAKLEAAVAGG